MRDLLAFLAICFLAAAAHAQVNTPIITGTNLTVSTLTTGVVLDVTPTISADGRYVTMGIHPTLSSLDGFQTFNSSGNNIGGNQAVGVAPLPFRPAQVGKVIFVENDKKLLAGEVSAMMLQQISLKDAARKLADAGKTNLVLGVRGLEQAGVDLALPHTFAIPQGTIKAALLEMLKTAAPEKDLVITADEGVIQVVSQAQADNNVITRTYYLEDLLANLPRVVSNRTDLYTLQPADEKPHADQPIPNGPAGVLPPAVAIVPKSGAASSTPSFASYDSGPGTALAAPADKPADNYSTTIAQVIMSSIRPEIWKANGGKIGEIAIVGDHVTIRAPASVHALLDGPKHYNPNAVPMYVGYGTH